MSLRLIDILVGGTTIVRPIRFEKVRPMAGALYSSCRTFKVSLAVFG